MWHELDRTPPRRIYDLHKLYLVFEMFLIGGTFGNIHTTFDEFINIWKTSYHSLWNRKSFHYKSSLDVAPAHGSHCHGPMFIFWILVCTNSSTQWPAHLGDERLHVCGRVEVCALHCSCSSNYCCGINQLLKAYLSMQPAVCVLITVDSIFWQYRFNIILKKVGYMRAPYRWKSIWSAGVQPLWWYSMLLPSYTVLSSTTNALMLHKHVRVLFLTS